MKDWQAKPFRRMVVMGESTVAGGGWLQSDSERWADVLVDQINQCQVPRVDYLNKGIGANAISPRSPGYEASAKPSALERYSDDVIAHKPDLFLLCYGLNDMRAGMPLGDFIEDMRTIIVDVREACDPLIVLTTIYYMTGWKSFPPFDRGSVELTENYNAAIAALAEEHGCLLSDLWAAEGGADWLINPDGVHANRVGNLVIAHRVFETLASHCSCLCESTYVRDMPTEWNEKTMARREIDGDPHDPWWRGRQE
jgi:lysophospholipase L1-like esterase